MRKIAILALCLILTACTLTACRRNAAGETVLPTDTYANTQASEHTTVTRPNTVEPTHQTTEHTMYPGDATDDNGILDDGNNENGRIQRIQPHY